MCKHCGMLMCFMCKFFFSRLARDCAACDIFSICSVQTILQGVTRVDDPIASIDLCLEAVVVAGMADMVLALVKSTHVFHCKQSRH